MEIPVSKDQVIVCDETRRREFFAALLAHPREFEALRERIRQYSWFGEVLVSYLRVINDKLETLLEELPGVDVSDPEFLGFCNWVLMQGCEQIQAFLDLSVGEFVDKYVRDGKCHLPCETAFWYRLPLKHVQ